MAWWLQDVELTGVSNRRPLLHHAVVPVRSRMSPQPGSRLRLSLGISRQQRWELPLFGHLATHMSGKAQQWEVLPTGYRCIVLPDFLGLHARQSSGAQEPVSVPHFGW